MTTDTPQKAAIEALEKLSGMTPDRPTAITFDRGWEIIDCVQNDISQHIPYIISVLRSTRTHPTQKV